MTTTQNPETWTAITAAEHNLALTIERRKSARTVRHMVDNLIRAHQSEGHDVIVSSGHVRCLDCVQTLDSSAARPGLVAENQSR